MNFEKYLQEKQILLKENPDRIIGLDGRKYDREFFSEKAFLIAFDEDNKSIFYAHLEDEIMPSHSYLLRKVRERKGIEGDGLFVFGKGGSSFENIDVDSLGIILGKTGDMDVSYVSFWKSFIDSDGFGFNSDRVDLLKKLLIHLNTPKPIYVENKKGGFYLANVFGVKSDNPEDVNHFQIL
jgi:hypothetical protein